MQVGSALLRASARHKPVSSLSLHRHRCCSLLPAVPRSQLCPAALALLLSVGWFLPCTLGVVLCMQLSGAGSHQPLFVFFFFANNLKTPVQDAKRLQRGHFLPGKRHEHRLLCSKAAEGLRHEVGSAGS